MVIVHSYDTERNAANAFDDFMHDNADNIECSNAVKKFIRCVDGGEHMFIGYTRFIPWRKGRTYMDTDGNIWHGDCIIRQ